MRAVVPRFLLLIFPILLAHAGLPGRARAQAPEGGLHGTVRDAVTLEPLVGANVRVHGLQRGAASGADGTYRIEGVPAGEYVLTCSYLGYQSRTLTDIVVLSQRRTAADFALASAAVEAGEVLVSAGYFTLPPERPVSVGTLSAEEVRRAAGSAGDISRVAMSLPGVGQVNDQSNGMAVRGGSPAENAFLIDGIEVPNINHFPSQGASGGPIGMVNVDFLREVSMLTGGFPAEYGDRLSSVMDLRFREGDAAAYSGMLDLNIAGFGGAAEGPIPGLRGSWLASIRRSYLDMLVRAFDAGTSAAPSYGDVQAKVVADVTASDRVGLFGLWGDDHNAPDREDARENDMTYYGPQDILQGTTGASWRRLWGARGYTTVSAAYTVMRYDEEFRETNTDALLMRNRSDERLTQLRSASRLELGGSVRLDAGGDLRIGAAQFDNAYPDADGGEAAVQYSGRTAAGGLFSTLSADVLSDLTLGAGLRVDYAGWSARTTLSPRLTAQWRATAATTLSAAAGVFRQNLPAVLLVQDAANRTLPGPYALHAILGVSHLLAQDLRLSVEAYAKEYRQLPTDPQAPASSVLDETSGSTAFYTLHGPLRADGRARAAGLEAMLQKKLSAHLYGIASASLFRTRCTAADGVERDRMFDNRFIFCLEGGWKPDDAWQLGMRWLYAGGAPYTPLDTDASASAGRAVPDATRTNAARYPAYHSLNLRCDRRFHFAGSSLTAYVSVWNVYGRKNVAGYDWDAETGTQKTLYQWGMLPIIGVQWAF